MRHAASSVARTISSGSLPGTIVVRKATRWPASGVMGTGSRAFSVASARVITLTICRTPMTATLPSSTTASTERQSPTYSGWWEGSSSQTRKTSSKTKAPRTSSRARTRAQPRVTGRKRTRPSAGGSSSGPASSLNSGYG